MRRRQRRLRSMLRHERQSIAMALAERLHHSANVTDLRHKEEVEQHAAPRGPKTARAEVEEVVNATHDALRGQNTPLPGVRPGILAEPGPQRSDRSRRPFSGDCLPTLSLPVLAGALGEQVDSSTLRFLTAAALSATRKLEEEEKEKAKMKKLKEEMEAAEHEEKMLELNRRVQADLPLSAAERSAWRQCIGIVFPLVVGRPAGRSVWTRRTIVHLAVLTGDIAPLAVCSRLLLSSSRCWTSWPVCLEEYRNTGFLEVTSYVSVLGMVRQWIQFYVSHQRPGLSCRGAEVDSHGLAVQQTMVFPQLRFLFEVIDAPGMQGQVPSTAAVHQQGRLPPYRGAEADSLGLTVQADHGDSPIAVHTVVDVPIALVVQVPLYLAAICTLFRVRLWSTGLWIF